MYAKFGTCGALDGRDQKEDHTVWYSKGIIFYEDQ